MLAEKYPADPFPDCDPTFLAQLGIIPITVQERYPFLRMLMPSWVKRMAKRDWWSRRWNSLNNNVLFWPVVAVCGGVVVYGMMLSFFEDTTATTESITEALV